MNTPNEHAFDIGWVPGPNLDTPNAPLLEQAADRLHAKYGTPKVVTLTTDKHSGWPIAMFEDGRWAMYEPETIDTGRWIPLPRLVYADIKGIGPTPEEAEGARDD